MLPREVPLIYDAWEPEEVQKSQSSSEVELDFCKQPLTEPDSQPSTCPGVCPLWEVVLAMSLAQAIHTGKLSPSLGPPGGMTGPL